MSRADGLDLSRMRRAIPRECHRIDGRRAFITLARCVGIACVLEYVLSRLEPALGWSLLWQAPLLLLLWFLLACAFVGLFVIGHDCGHASFSRRPGVNSLVGHLCMAPLLTGFHNWRIAHAFHHAHAQCRGMDPDWPEKMVTLDEFRRLPFCARQRTLLGFGSAVGLLAGFWVGVGRRFMLGRSYPQIALSSRARLQAAGSNAVMLGAAALVLAGLWRCGGPWALMKHYGVPVLIGAALGSLLTLLHHSGPDSLVFDRLDWTPLRGQVLSTFQVRFPAILEWMWLDINIHLPHHLAPRIPWYHLRAASEALRREFPEYHQERPFAWRDLLRMWSRPFLERAGECYVMTGRSRDHASD